MVGRDVEEHGYVGAEAVHVVELEGGELDDVAGMGCLGHLQGQAVANVAGQAHVGSCLAQYVVDERGGGGFAVAARDANHAGIGEACGKLDFAQYRRALLHELLHKGRGGRYAGALDHLVGIEQTGLGVLAFLPRNAVGIEHVAIVGLDGRHVAYKHFVALLFSQYGSTYAALGGT